MNIVNKLTISHLKENKSRTVVTVLGICVSVAMITAVFVCLASFMKFYGDETIYSGGNFHAELYSVSKEDAEKMEKDDRIASVARGMGFETSARTQERKSERTGVFSVFAGDERWVENYVTCNYRGTLPKNENEIAVEKEYIERNDLKWEIGDTITIETGARYFYDEAGEKVSNDNAYSYYSQEKFAPSGKREYKLTAILDGNRPANGAIRGIGDNEKENAAVTSILLNNVNMKSLDTTKEIIKDYNVSEYRINGDYFESVFAIDKDSMLAKSIFPMALIVLAIIIIASVSLIYNAFGMSLNERVRYLGMLASVGATKAQKRKSVYYEGFILGAVGIPVGILAGIAGIGITLSLLGDKIVSTGMLNSGDISFKTVVPVWAIAGIVIVSAFTIFISSFIPAKKASSITPIEALRQTKEIKIKSKKLTSPKLVRKIFGYEGELAHKNLKRNGRKSRVITFSIALSVVLFLSVNYFCDMFNQANSMQQDIPYQVTVTVGTENISDMEKELDNMQEVNKYYYAHGIGYEIGKKSDFIDDKSWFDKGVLTSTYENYLDGKSALYMNVVSDEDFKKLCQDNSVDYKQFYSENQKALILNNVSHKDDGAKVFTDKVIGKKIGDFEIGGLVDFEKDNDLFKLNPKGFISTYVPMSNYLKYNDPGSVTIGIETEENETVTEKIENLIDENNYSYAFVSDMIESMESMNTVILVIEVFSYGFITLITMITVANIINTVSTGIQLRRKEFAMLKSVGTTPKGFRKMISLESLFMGFKALVFGLPVAVLLSFCMNLLLGSDSIPFVFNWKIYLGVTLAVFVIIGISMFYSVSKLKDDSIVETLKEDIS